MKSVTTLPRSCFKNLMSNNVPFLSVKICTKVSFDLSMCHSLNYSSVADSTAAASSPSLLLKNKILRISTFNLLEKSNIVAKTTFSRKQKFFYCGAVLYTSKEVI